MPRFLAPGSLLCLLVAGCTPMPPPGAPPPRPDGSTVTPPVGGGRTDDAGASTDGEAVRGDGGSSVVCTTITTGSSANSITLTGSDFPSDDFLPNRLTAQWDPASCAEPRLVITLAQNECRLGLGHRVTLSILDKAIQEARVGTTRPINLLSTRDQDVQLTYVRPVGLAGSGARGPCATGSISFTSVATAVGSRIRGSFSSVFLSSCDAGTTLASAAVSGAFDVTVTQPLREVCPSP